MSTLFRVALPQDLLDSKGEPSFGREPLAVLAANQAIRWEVSNDIVKEITADHCAAFDALYVSGGKVAAGAVARADCRVRLIARHGVGYDNVDIPAMTAAGVMVTNTPVAVRRPVATMTITFMLALAHKLPVKDRLTRSGRWSERTDHMGVGLTGRTFGLVGVGGIGKELLRMLTVFNMRVIAADPHVDASTIQQLGATKVELDALMRESDFVAIACLLNDETRGLIDARRIGLMKPSAYLINVARGPIVVERALHEALAARRIAGAALDVFEQEPTPADNPILKLDNVIVSPHSLCWTDEMFRDIARSGLQSVADVAARRRPQFLVDPKVLEHPRVEAWLAAS
jgi:D-3-phosphoglycerate dehydrogenase